MASAHIIKAEGALRTIREVADDLGLEPYVLRFWEKEFPQLKPVQQAGGRRYYAPADIELLQRIRHLLHEEGYTIKGARAVLESAGEKPAHLPQKAPQGVKKPLRSELEGLHQQLRQLRSRIALQLSE